MKRDKKKWSREKDSSFSSESLDDVHIQVSAMITRLCQGCRKAMIIIIMMVSDGEQSGFDVDDGYIIPGVGRREEGASWKRLLKK